MDLENSHHFLATIAVHSLLCITAFISTMISRVFLYDEQHNSWPAAGKIFTVVAQRTL